ncbi:MAG: hypothetical protein FWF54_08525 [Candidatus Azobacteroides sp.]|nr:hypothetical protein [Candidatus Azobacteroides sp.]
MEAFTALIVIAAAILYIIMIVKFFQIASDVKDLRRNIYPNKSDYFEKDYDRFYFLAFNGYKDEAKKLLLTMIWGDSYMIAMKFSENESSFDTYLEKLKSEYQKYFDLLGEEFPDYNLLKNNLKLLQKKSQSMSMWNRPEADDSVNKQ